MKPDFIYTAGLMAYLLLAPASVKTPVVLPGNPDIKASEQIPIHKNPFPLNSAFGSEKAKGQVNGGPALDTDKLKGGNWYNTVTAEIARRSYDMVTHSDSVVSINPKQGMQAVYHSAGFTLSSLPQIQDPGKPVVEEKQTADDWKLDLSFLGLYADNLLIITPDTNPKISVDTSQALFTYRDDFTVQYQNGEEGTRQNFIVNTKPSADTRELRVKLSIDNAWTVNQANQDELHFALQNPQGGLNTKVIYKDLNAWDARGRKLVAEMQLEEGNNFSLVVAAADAVYPVTIDPLSTTASTTLNGTAGSNFGIAVAGAGDVNGDGFSDVIVGAMGAFANAGAAYVYTGTATGLGTVPAKTLTGFANSYFGSNVASAGDVNGDGYSDIIVGAFNYMEGAGAAYVYMGSAGGLSGTAAVSLSGSAGSFFGRCVSTAGDVNYDGYSDVIVGAPRYASSTGQVFLYKGTATGLSASPAQVLTGITTGSSFGFSLSNAGDVNGDSHSDIIVGAFGVSKAYVHHGNAVGLASYASTVLTSPGVNDSFALSVAGAGDVNGDGYSEVIVGAYGGGAAYIYNGSTAGILGTRPRALFGSSDGKFGVSVAGAGDIDADGYADVIVGASGVNSYAGATYVYMGGSAGITTGAASTLAGTGSNSFFGSPVAGAGDVNGDGFSDVVVGASGVSSGSGASYIYLGSPARISAPYTSVISGTNSFGSNLASAGDVNADGYGDVIVAAPYGSGGQGYVYLYLGSATGLSTTAATVVTSGVIGEFFGYSLDGAGDVNRDGYADVIIGTLNKGAAYLFRGNEQGLYTTYKRLGQGYGGVGFGFAVAGAGDVNADGFADVIVSDWTNSQANILLGNLWGLDESHGVLFGPPGINFGRNVAGIGDVNGDGYADVMVGAYHETTVETFTEKAFVYMGKSNVFELFSVAVTLSSPYSDIRGFGSEITSAGDVNGDGYDDVVLGAAGSNSGVGRVLIYRGAANGISTIPSQTLTGSPGSFFGCSVSSGDFNRDGYSDLVIGASDYNEYRGAVYVFSGSPTVSFQQGALFGEGIVGFGKCVAGAGDVNGDGFSDIVIGTRATGLVYTYTGNGGKQMTSRLKVYNPDLTTPFVVINSYQTSFGIGLFVKPINGVSTARLVWETQPNGTAFNGTTGQIKNYTGYTAAGPWTVLPPAGTELKTVIAKTAGRVTKVRVRIQYKSTKSHNGQVFGPWVYFQNYNKSILRRYMSDPAREAAEVPPATKQSEAPLLTLTVYPNPVTNYLKLNMGDNTDWNDLTNIQLFNVNGQIVYSCEKTVDGTVNVSSLASGNFIIRVHRPSGQVFQAKFVVKR